MALAYNAYQSLVKRLGGTRVGRRAHGNFLGTVGRESGRRCGLYGRREIRMKMWSGFLMVCVVVAASAWGAEKEVAGLAGLDLGNPKTSMCPPGVARKVTPVLEAPLRDAAICRGPEGVYYLTGTSATRRADGTLDFQNNDGVWLWKSKDLKTWEAMGQVWSIAGSSRGFAAPNKWQLRWRGNANADDDRPVRGMTSPEVHWVKGNFYITYSMNGQGTGLLASAGGKAEGPYRDVGRMTLCGGDASLFEDDDGAVYWVWGAGWIARMKEDLTGLAEKPRPLELEAETKTSTCPFRIGQGGAFIFKAPAPGLKHGSYHLVGYDFVPRMGGVMCKDTMIATAETVYGPYKRRDMMVPHGGQSTVFEGPDRGYMATFNGADSQAAFRDKPGIVPLVPHATKRGADYWWCGAFIKPFYPVTAGGAWGDIDPFVKDIAMRDVTVLNAPDGFYYLTGTDMALSRQTDRKKMGIEMWRSKDMKDWESMGIVWHPDEHPLSRRHLDKRLALNEGRKRPFTAPILYDVEIHHLKGTFWLVSNLQSGEQWWHKDGSLILMLRSKSGKAEGPYDFMWKGKHDPEFWTPSIFEDDDGTCYIIGGGVGNTVAQLNDDLSDIVGGKWRIWPEGNYIVGEGGHLTKIGGKYIHTHRNWNGMAQIAKTGYGNEYPRWRLFSTYDLMYSTADSLKGPWSPSRCLAPRCGNSKPFRDKAGNWWTPFFGDLSPGPWYSKPGAYPVRVRKENGDVVIEAVK
jgi:hypothetical protein